MRRIGGFCFVVASLVAMPELVFAQRCLGAASFADGHLRASVSSSTVSGWRYNAIGLSIGHERGAFVSGGASRASYTGADVTNNGLNASVGYQVPIGTRLQFCPTLLAARSRATYSYGRTLVDNWGTTTGISTALGVTAWSSRRFEIVPSAELIYTTYTGRVQAATQGIEQEARGTRHTGTLSIAPGLIIGKMITVKPFVSIPVAHTGGENLTGISLSVSFGAKK